MDKLEARRLHLLRLVTSLGRGGRAKVAATIGKTPDYVSRMLYPKGKDGHKGIGENSADLLTQFFPGWDNPHGVVVQEPQPVYLPAAISVQQALDVLERELSALDMAGRERVAPLFESFARSPGSVVKQDIADTLQAGVSKKRAAA